MSHPGALGVRPLCRWQHGGRRQAGASLLPRNSSSSLPHSQNVFRAPLDTQAVSSYHSAALQGGAPFPVHSEHIPSCVYLGSPAVPAAGITPWGRSVTRPRGKGEAGCTHGHRDGRDSVSRPRASGPPTEPEGSEGPLNCQVFYCQLLPQAMQTEVTGCFLGHLGTGAREGSRTEQCHDSPFPYHR